MFWRKLLFLYFLLGMIVGYSSEAQMSKEFIRPWQKWVKRLDDVDKLPRLYLKQAVMITQDDIIVGQAPIKNYIADNQAFFTRFTSSHSVKLYEHSEHKVLQLGYITIEDENDVTLDSVLSVVAWRKVGRDWLRELDVIVPANKTHSMDDEFAAQRSAWVSYANSGDPLKLATTLFLDDGVYLNNSEISRGHAEITKRFEFMRNATFQINLRPETLIHIDDKTAIDIGNWLTSDFVGYYFIVWKKSENNEWKILLYFNY